MAIIDSTNPLDYVYVINGTMMCDRCEREVELHAASPYVADLVSAAEDHATECGEEV